MSRTWQWSDNENCWIRCCQTIAITRCSADDITIHANIAPWSSAEQFSTAHRIFTSTTDPVTNNQTIVWSTPSLTQTCDLRHCFVFTRWSDTLAVYIQLFARNFRLLFCRIIRSLCGISSIWLVAFLHPAVIQLSVVFILFGHWSIGLFWMFDWGHWTQFSHHQLWRILHFLEFFAHHRHWLIIHQTTNGDINSTTSV